MRIFAISMKLLSFIAAFLLILPSAQQSRQNYWDNLLDKYEELCEACKSGKPKVEISRISKEFNLMVKHPVGKISQAQKNRFADIQNRYRGYITIANTNPTEANSPRVVKVDTVRRVEHVRVVDTVFVKEILGEVNINNNISIRDTVYHIHIVQHQLMQIDSTVRAESANSAPVPERKWKVLFTGQIGAIPNLSYGAMVGAVNKWGCYAKFRSNFKNPAADYECLSDGTTARGRIMTNGNYSCSLMNVTAGAALEATPWLIAYAGAGYGLFHQYWQDIDDKWVRISDASYAGVSIDVGTVFHFRNFALSAGAGLIGFKVLELEAGLGILF